MNPEVLDKWRKNLIREIVEAEMQEGDEPTLRTFRGRKILSAGMAAAQEVYELVGRLELLDVLEFQLDELFPEDIRRMNVIRKEAEAKLKALLGGKVE